jgi:hypothetical protein
MFRTPLWVIALALIIACYGAIGQQAPQHTDDFEHYSPSTWSEGQIVGEWHVDFTGFGTAGVESDNGNLAHFQIPKASTQPNETHASLTTSVYQLEDFQLSVRMKTVRQLRTPSPNPWEVAWLMWHFTDNTHFYYFTLKPNGWELGKGDSAYPGAQRFLATGPTPKLEMGIFQQVRVEQSGATMRVSVDGREVADFTDTERPYLEGRIGLYNEDAHVRFDDVLVK